MKDRRMWSKKEVTYLKWAASRHVNTHKIAAHLRRSEIAVRQKAFELELSLETRQSMIEPNTKVEPIVEQQVRTSKAKAAIRIAWCDQSELGGEAFRRSVDDDVVTINVDKHIFGDASLNVIEWLTNLKPKQALELARSMLTFGLEQAENYVQRKHERKAAEQAAEHKAEHTKAKRFELKPVPPAEPETDEPTAEVIPLTDALRREAS